MVRGGDGEEAAAGQVLKREELKAADLFRLEGLLEHCVEAFGRGLKVDTAIEHLVWAQRQASGGAQGGDRVLCSQWPTHSGWKYLQLCPYFLRHLCFCTVSNKFLLGKGLEGEHRVCCVFSSDSRIVLISIFHCVYVARFGQHEARETWQLLKLLPSDVHHDILEAMFD